jgi:hypothetical protein
MELLVKPEILTSYIYGPMFGNAESRLFLFAAQCFNIESMQKIFLFSQLCVNTLPATKITLITDGISFGSLRVKTQGKFGITFSENKIASYEAENTAYSTVYKKINFGLSIVLTLHIATTTIRRLSVFSSLCGEVTNCLYRFSPR